MHNPNAKRSIYALSFLMIFLYAMACSTPKPTQEKVAQEKTSDAKVAQESKIEKAPDANIIQEAKVEKRLDTSHSSEQPPIEMMVENSNPPPEKKTDASSTPDGPVTAGLCKKKSPKCPADYLCDDERTPKTCRRRCDPTQNNSCPSSSLCLVLQSGEGFCVSGQIAQKKQPCDLQKICATGLICVRQASGSPKGTCYQRCTLKNDTCPANEYCFLIHTQNGVCLKGTAGQKVEGHACKNTSECAARLLCFTPVGGSPSCSRLCDKENSCPKGFRCADLKSAPKGSGACTKL